MEIGVVKSIPENIGLKEVIRAVTEFYTDCGFGMDYKGFLQHTLDRFAFATFLNRPEHELWMAEEHGEIKAYVLASIDRASDNSLSYFINQTWFSKDIRNTKFSSDLWKKVKAQAKNRLCKHIIISSVREKRAYERLLGEELAPYSELFFLNLE